MNSTQHLHRPANGFNRLMKWPLLGGLLTLALAHTALAASAGYTNDASVNYPLNQANPPVIDATNFVNTGTFIINFTQISGAPPYYETSDTMMYSNTGTMMANTGFRFDNRSISGTRSNSASFFNSGLVSAGSVANTGDPYGGFLYLFGYAPQIFVNATNLTSSGKINVGLDGYLQLAGQTVDLTHGTLNMEGASANVGGTGIFGDNTNGWDPGAFLGSTSAESAFFPLSPYFLLLTNSTAYIHQDGVGTSNVIIRAVFLQDTSGSSVSNNVYFHPPFSLLAQGGVTIEWIGSHTDTATGVSAPNYLYLENDYPHSVATNLTYVGGIPDNFTFTESSTPISIGVNPANPGFLPIFPAGAITNRYSFANAQLISTSVSTNDVTNPTHAITNLPGRIEISAAKELDLTAALITGPNYLSLQAPNQFDGSPRATIQSPYSDLNLGVTNGFLTISNLLAPNFPNWSGTVQAWSTRWLAVDANGVTNDYRVLIVGSQVAPQSSAQVQDLKLHATNSLVISDTFNILRSFTADAQNLTLTTNGPGAGATSLAGELNVASGNFSWVGALPNLRNLTNNGAIRLQSLNYFNGISNIFSVTPGTSAVAASGTLAEVSGRTNVLGGNRVQIGTNYYTFTRKLTNTLANQILIASKFDGTLSNLIAAINGAAGAGTRYSTNTKASGEVSAGLLINHAFTVTAITAGLAGTNIDTAVSVSTTNLVWTGSHLVGGADATPGSTNLVGTTAVPYDNFINNGLLSDQGSTIWAKSFVSSGVISNSALGSFSLNSLTATLTNGLVQAGGDILITANSLVASNVTLQAGRSLNLSVTNLLTDSDATNGNIWTVQNPASPGGNGLILSVKPAQGDLRATTITNYVAGSNPQTINIWAGQDRGVSVAGYTNNVAVGRLILDAMGSVSEFKFSGATSSNALYVDSLEFRDYLTNGINNNFDFSANLSINTNLVIYFAQATANGISIAAKIDAASRAGRNNGGRLRWIPAYTGRFSSVNVVYPDGTTNAFNAALATSTTIDSDGDGIPNASDPTPFFVASQVGLSISITNPLPTMLIKWNSFPGATNTVYYRTNLASLVEFVLTNFVSPSVIPPSGGWPITNRVYDVNPPTTRFYNVMESPNATLFYGP